MHPCCWQNFFQSLIHLIPALAVIAMAAKKIVSASGILFRLPTKKSMPPVVESVQPVAGLSQSNNECSCHSEQKVAH
jgi:hypothetical protein